MGSSYLPPQEQNVVNVGDELSQAAIDAINSAVSPSASNPFLTQNDPGVQGPPGPAGNAWTYQGEYSNGMTYIPNDYVTFNGSSYVMTNFIGGAGYEPPSFPGNWQLVAQKGDVGPQGDQGPAGADGSSGINDAPADGTAYVRINYDWQPLSSYDQNGGIEEAPNDGNPYVRVSSTWQPFSNYDQSGGIGDAPYDGNYYLRKDGSWHLVSTASIYDSNSGNTYTFLIVQP